MTINERIEQRKKKLITASEILAEYLSLSDELLFRASMQKDCLEEMSLLVEEVVGWLDDEGTYSEMAWQLESSGCVDSDA